MSCVAPGALVAYALDWFSAGALSDLDFELCSRHFDLVLLVFLNSLCWGATCCVSIIRRKDLLAACSHSWAYPLFLASHIVLSAAP